MFENELNSPNEVISTAPSKSATVSLVGLTVFEQNQALLLMIQDANDLCDALGY